MSHLTFKAGQPYPTDASSQGSIEEPEALTLGGRGYFTMLSLDFGYLIPRVPLGRWGLFPQSLP